MVETASEAGRRVDIIAALDDVVPGTNDECIVVVAAAQDVVAVAAIDRILTVTTVEQIVSGITPQEIIAAKAKYLVVTVTATQFVGVIVANDPVIKETATDIFDVQSAYRSCRNPSSNTRFCERSTLIPAPESL